MKAAPRAPAAAPPPGFRPYMPLETKIAATLITLGLPEDRLPAAICRLRDFGLPKRDVLSMLLIVCGLDPADTHFDHSPSLQARVWNEAAQNTVPTANDPKFIVPLASADHRDKTSGPSTKARAQGDQTEIARTKNLAESQAAFRDRILAKGEPREAQTSKPKRKIPSRPFQRRKA
jgi:hypothetical protein